jgi:hypothetical protein
MGRLPSFSNLSYLYSRAYFSTTDKETSVLWEELQFSTEQEYVNRSHHGPKINNFGLWLGGIDTTRTVLNCHTRVFSSSVKQIVDAN